MFDAPLSVIDSSNGTACKIVASVSRHLLNPFLIDVAHSVEPNAFVPIESFVSAHIDRALVYGCGYGYDCCSPAKFFKYTYWYWLLANRSKRAQCLFALTLNVADSMRQCTHQSRTNFFRFSLSSPFFSSSSLSVDLSTSASSPSTASVFSSVDSVSFLSSLSLALSVAAVDFFETPLFFFSESFSVSDLASFSSVFDLSAFSPLSLSAAAFRLAAAVSRFFSELNTNYNFNYFCFWKSWKCFYRYRYIASACRLRSHLVILCAMLRHWLISVSILMECGLANLEIAEWTIKSKWKYLLISLARRTASRLRLAKRRRIMFDRTDETSLERRILAPVSATSRAMPPLPPPNFRTVLVTGQIFEYNKHDNQFFCLSVCVWVCVWEFVIMSRCQNAETL